MNRSFSLRLCLLSSLCVCFVGETPADETKASKKTAIDKIPTYVIQRAKSKIAIDGEIDEEDWKNAKSVGDFVFGYLKETTGNEEQTVFKILWDDEHLYFSVVCEDKSLLSRHTDRDGRVPEDDSVEVYITPNIKKADRHYAFYTNVHAALYDAKFDRNKASIDKKSIQKKSTDKTAKNGKKSSWDAKGVKVKATFDGTLNNHKDTDRSWSLEMAIPFENFSDASIPLPPKPNDIWKLNPNRHAYMPDGSCLYSQWAPTIAATGSFWGPEFFGKVIFSGEAASSER